MGLFNFLDPILNAAILPLISINRTLALLVIVFFVSIIITISYKFMTNQSLMKDLKDEINRLQKELKKLSKNPDKAMKVQSEMMETNMKYMMHSMRSTLITFVPIIIIFGWLSAHIAYLPISPGEDFTVEVIAEYDEVSINTPPQLQVEGSNTKETDDKNKVSWILTGNDPGTYMIEFIGRDETITKKVLITNGNEYIKPTMRRKGFTDAIYESNDEYIPKESEFKSVTVGNTPFKSNLLGLRLGWLWTYILFSIIFSTILRKLLKVY